MMFMLGNGKAHAALLVAVSLALLLMFAGCTSNKYVPCCVKSNIYQENGEAFADPKCVFQNGTEYGLCITVPDTRNVVFCSDGATTCADLESEEACIATFNCDWNASLTPKCQGGLAQMPLPVCTDLVPKSCTNDKCTAMVCGYTDIRPAPPPSSQDWDAEKASNTFTNDPNALPANMPANELQVPTIGLQKVTCDFNTMNNKLYNKVKASRGALWVNSFRFGVGSSFSDFEAAKNYFPATDRACAANPSAQVDRFTVYFGDYNFCQPSNTYYLCSGPKFGGLAFKTEQACKLYCGGGAPPYSCNLTTAVLPKYMCNQDGFAYDSNDTCQLKCSRIDDPNACANNATIFPFLATDDTGLPGYRMKYVSDYMVDSRDPYMGHSSQTCIETAGPDSRYPFYRWVENTLSEPNHCNDYVGNPNGEWVDGPWFSTYSCSYANSWQTPNPCPLGSPSDVLGEQRTYFDNHAYSALDFDYEYYARALLWQYSSADQSKALPFECESSSDCLSGSCDTTHYKRPMCIDIYGQAVACSCTAKEFGSSKVSYPSCSLFDSTGDNIIMYADTGIYPEGVYNHIASDVNSGGPMFYPDDSLHYNGAPTLAFRYYALAPAPNSPRPKVFEMCGVQPTRVQKCIMYDKYIEGDCSQTDPGDCVYTKYTTDEKVIWTPHPDGKCHYSAEEDEGYVAPPNPVYPQPSWYWEYYFGLGDPNPAMPVNMEKFGNCKLNGNITNNKLPVPPYLKTKDLGWCAGCSYATLAVQKVDWGAATNPGGYSAPRQYSCYEYRGDFNYIPSNQKLPYGGPVEFQNWSSEPINNGQVRWSGTLPSTEPVRRTSNPSAPQFDTNGNIALSWGSDGASPSYVCQDEWHASGGWWSPAEIPTPSAPYLRDKLTSYLQSNVMPILDEINEKTSVTSINGGYDPLFICKSAAGDGGVLHVIGNTTMLSSGTHAGVSDYGSIKPSDWSEEIKAYMNVTGSATVTFPPNSLGGKNAILARSELLKGKCETPPLTGIEIMPGETEASLIGNSTVPGKLHNFFFKASQQGYDQRVARGLPDKFPDKVDMLMQDWYPVCLVGSSLHLGEREIYEFEKRTELSRALLSNFSKPSLIWKFAFPIDTRCNKTFFLDYLFNNTQAMVDAGITGIIYSDWSMQDGLGYGPSHQYYADDDTYPALWNAPAVTHSLPNLVLDTGLTELPPYERGGTPSDLTFVLDDRYGGTGKTSLFCALEKYSLRSIGYTSLTYGQKLYAENQTCYCTPCTFYDEMMGVCDIGGPNSNSIPQLYCNDGTKCTMPDGETAYNQYKCEARCMNYTACKLCTSPANANHASFCRFSDPGGVTTGYSRDYSNITDDYWEFLTGLSPSEKCCLENTAQGASGTKYTYVGVSGSKQQSVFLQYPSRGEFDLDCGRAPDTSVLSYCNIKVPISQKEIACMRIDKPISPIRIEPAALD
jgi:hypothetical protein